MLPPFSNFLGTDVSLSLFKIENQKFKQKRFCIHLSLESWPETLVVRVTSISKGLQEKIA